jgi:hypothetical protein
MSVLVKDFGNNTECDDIFELEKVLVEKYINKSITIVSKNASGTLKLNYVDVNADGTLIGSYCRKNISLSSFSF